MSCHSNGRKLAKLRDRLTKVNRIIMKLEQKVKKQNGKH
jgi:hypothetical protein